MTTPDITWPRTAGPLTFRQPTPESVDEVLTWRNRPEVTRWMLKTIVDPDEFRRRWLEEADDPKDHSSVVFADDQVIGTASLWIVDAMGQEHAGRDVWQNAEAGIGYMLNPEFAGRGYGTLIARTLLELAFRDLGLVRVTAGCFADNIASWKIMEKAGMRREQHGVKDSWHAELGWLDGYTYAIRADEWAAQN